MGNAANAIPNNEGQNTYNNISGGRERERERERALMMAESVASNSILMLILYAFYSTVYCLVKTIKSHSDSSPFIMLQLLKSYHIRFF